MSQVQYTAPGTAPSCGTEHLSKVYGLNTDRALVLLDGRIVDDVPNPSADQMLATVGRLGA